MKIIIICGGNSLEKEISVRTGIAVQSSLKKAFNTELLLIKNDYSKIKDIYDNDDIVFNALHGGDGENGTIQAFFEKEGISFIGSGSEACEIAMDKHLCKKKVKSIGVDTPFGRKINSGISFYDDFQKPFIIKPNQEGSSLGFFKIETKADALKAIKLNKKITNKIIAEEFIVGREISVPILDGKPYPIIEICPKNNTYDYECKYTSGMSDYIVPAKIDKNIEIDISKKSIDIFNAIGARHYARIDYILTDQNVPYFLEINTYPGMTGTSLFPMSLKSIGVSFDTLIIRLIDLVLKKK